MMYDVPKMHAGRYLIISYAKCQLLYVIGTELHYTIPCNIAITQLMSRAAQNYIYTIIVAMSY